MVRWLARYWVWIAAPVVLFVAASVSARPIGPPDTLAPSFELTNQRGETVSLSHFQGKAVALTFLYTYCPDTCPIYIARIHQAFDQIGPVSDKVAVAVVTVDPERDTQDTISAYAGRWPSGWHFLTGTPGQLKTVWDNYGIVVQKEAPEPGSHDGQNGYSVSHTAKAVLIDTHGNKAAELKGNWAPDELAEKLELLASGRAVVGASFGQSALVFLYDCGSVVFAGLGQAVTHAVTMAAILGGLAIVLVVLWR